MVHEVKHSSVWPEYQAAIMEELQAHKKNGTWILVPPEQAKGKNILDSMLILSTKYKASGEISRRKARLVARGDQQKRDRHLPLLPN